MPGQYAKLVAEFPKRLALATAEKPLVLFLDALDQLSDADQGRNFAWLPAELPEHVRLVVSTLPGDSLKALEQSRIGEASGLPEFLEITPMNAADGEELLTAWLTEARRTLIPDQRREVLEKFASNGLPLYLKLAFEEARRWKSWMLPVSLMPDIPGILQLLFARLEQSQHHGRILVSRALGFLAASQHGLTEDELLDVLSADKEVMDDFQKRSPKSPKLNHLPVIVWARLFADLEPYMIRRQADSTRVLTFYHRHVGEAATARYLPNAERLRFHNALANYFRAQADPQLDKSWICKAKRPFRQLPFHLLRTDTEALAQI